MDDIRGTVRDGEYVFSREAIIKLVDERIAAALSDVTDRTIYNDAPDDDDA